MSKLIMRHKPILLLLVSIGSISASASPSIYDLIEVDGIFYRWRLDTSEVYVTHGETKAQKYAGQINIPASIIYDDEIYPVTIIGPAAFENCPDLTSVSIPNSVVTIEYRAFNNCTGLTSLIIPNSVTVIGYAAFESCYNLESVSISNSLNTISDCAFTSCLSLTEINIPNSVTTIGDSAFRGCDGLTSITIPNSIIS